jgi:hypothetical protein
MKSSKLSRSLIASITPYKVAGVTSPIGRHFPTDASAALVLADNALMVSNAQTDRVRPLLQSHF